jgi:hypothetical protein
MKGVFPVVAAGKQIFSGFAATVRVPLAMGL